MSYKLGFLKLRFSVEEGSKKEKIIKKIIKIENSIKVFFYLLFAKCFIKISKQKRLKHRVCINKQKFYFYDLALSTAYQIIVQEMNNDSYNLSKIDFKENDVIIDIGANIGVVSIYLAKKYPFLKIYSFEPFKENYESFLENIKVNKIPEGIIKPFNKAVTKDGRNIVMKADNFLNSGGFTIDFKKDNLNSNDKNIVQSTTLDNIIETILKENKQNHVKLLKMDCELSEYEILKNTKPENLKKISYFSAEFHEKENFGNPDELEEYVKKYIPNITITKCKMD